MKEIMPDFSDEEKIQATILYHLRRKRVIGGVHTAYATLRRGFPSHLGKEIERAAQDLIKKGFITTKPAPYGLQVSLNRGKIAEIEEFILCILGCSFD